MKKLMLPNLIIEIRFSFSYQVNMSKFDSTIKIGDHSILSIRKTSSENIFLGAVETGEMVVLKKFYSKITFEKEKGVYEKLGEHPNILKCLGWGNYQGFYFLILEYAKEGDLYKKVLRENLDFSLAKSYFLQIADAVRHCHHHGVIHMDIKPENVFLFGNQVKLADFDGSFFREVDEKNVKYTRDYAAPELKWERNVLFDEKMDVWSLGALLHFMLTGKELIDPGFVICKNLEEDARDLISRIMVSRNRRIGLGEILDHPFCNAVVK
jgi:serine/threonine protein kinase